MKLHLPKMLLAAVVAACMAVPATVQAAAITTTDLTGLSDYNAGISAVTVGTGTNVAITPGSTTAYNSTWNFVFTVGADELKAMQSTESLLLFALNTNNASGILDAGDITGRTVTLGAWGGKNTASNVSFANAAQTVTFSLARTGGGSGNFVLKAYADGDFDNALFTVASTNDQSFRNTNLTSLNVGTSSSSPSGYTAPTSGSAYNVYAAGFTNSVATAGDLTTYYNSLGVGSELTWAGTSDNHAWASDTWQKAGETVSYNALNASVTFGADESISKTVTLNGPVKAGNIILGADYSIEGSGKIVAKQLSGAHTLSLGEEIALSITNLPETTIAGSGNLILSGVAINHKYPNPKVKINFAEDWSGVVTLKDLTVTEVDLDNFAQNGSVVELSGVTGYLSNYASGDLSTNIKLTDNGSTKALTITNGGSSSSLIFSGAITGSGTFDFNSTVNPQKYSDPIFTGNLTGFSGTFNCPVAVMKDGQQNVANDQNEGILQFGATSPAAYSTAATVGEDRIIHNIAGSGIINTTSVLRFNYAANNERYTALGIDNSAINARYVEFNRDGGTANYVVTAALTGKNDTIANNTIKATNAETTIKGTVDNFGNIIVADGATLTFAYGSTWHADGTATNSGTMNLNGTIVIDDFSLLTEKEGSTETYSDGANGGFLLSSRYLVRGGTVSTTGVTLPDGYIITTEGSDTLIGGRENSIYHVLQSSVYSTEKQMDLATRFEVAENAVFTANGSQINGRDIVLSAGSELKATAVTYFNVDQIKTLTLEGNATINTNGNNRIALVDMEGGSPAAVTLATKGHTLTMTGGGFVGLVGNVSVTGNGKLVLADSTRLQIGYSDISGYTTTAAGSVLEMGNGSTLAIAGGNTISVKGINMNSETAAAIISKDSSEDRAPNLTLNMEADGAYTFRGKILDNTNLTITAANAAASQTLVLTENSNLGTISMSNGTLNIEGAGKTLTAQRLTLSMSNNTLSTVNIATGTTLNITGTTTSSESGGNASFELCNWGFNNVINVNGVLEAHAGISMEGNGSPVINVKSGGVLAMHDGLHAVKRAGSAAAVINVENGATLKTAGHDADSTSLLTVNLKDGSKLEGLYGDAASATVKQNMVLADNATVTVQTAEGKELKVEGSLSNESASLVVQGGGKLSLGNTTELKGLTVAESTDLLITNVGEDGFSLNSLSVGAGAKVTLGSEAEDGHNYTLALESLTVGGNATINANVEIAADSVLDFTSGGIITLGCSLDMGSGIVVTLSDEAMTTLNAHGGTAVTLFTGVDNFNGPDMIHVTNQDGTQSGVFFMNYDGSNVNIVPEPATATLSLLALAGLAARRRRH